MTVMGLKALVAIPPIKVRVTVPELVPGVQTMGRDPLVASPTVKVSCSVGLVRTSKLAV
jgi:hypothetical protein